MTPEQAAIKRATLAAQQDVLKLDAAALEDLRKLYQQAADDIAKRIAAHAGSDGNVMLHELQNVLNQVNAKLKELAVARNQLLDRTLTVAVELGTQPMAESAAITSAAAMKINHDALQFVRNFIAADGLQLSDRIWRLDRQAHDLVANAIEQAVIEGHGAAQAAREFLARGAPVPVELQEKIGAASASKIGKTTTDALLTGEGNPMDNAMRVMRTEINRAYGEPHIKSSMEHPDAAGLRFKLSPRHPKPDICDLHASANLHGLGSGVYPNRESCPWPAHPNTISFVDVVFKDEITEADRAGKETPLQALARLTPVQQIGVLGKNKFEAFKAGKLTQGMIGAKWSAVQKRIGDIKPKAKTPRPSVVSKVLTIDEFINAGHEISTSLLNTATKTQDGRMNAKALLEKLHEQLRAARNMMTVTKIQNGGKGAELVRKASLMFPDDWTKLADNYGPLFAKLSSARGQYVDYSHVPVGWKYRQYGFTGITKGGEGFIRAGNFSTAVHEYAHRLQHAIPQLDDIFQTLHERRTRGDRLEYLRSLFPGYGYGRAEVTRKDKYISAYQGRTYSRSNYLGKHGALEVMTVAFQNVLGGKEAEMLLILENDREMFDLVVGLLFKYVP